MSNKYYGLYQGIVTNINDPEKRGRIKVLCPTVLGSKYESAWCDPLVSVAYDNGGDFCIPSIDEAVWLQFIEGDANRPVWLGGWWQKNMTPLGSTYSEIDKVRIISYADCTLVMRNGVIDINVKNGEADLRIENGKISINGDLTVNGVVSAKSISTVGNGGTVTASEIVAQTIKASGSLNSGSITADSVSANSVSANGVSLAEHTHGGVASGSNNTRKPN